MQANPTLDQLQVFLTVAEEGGFSAAARVLNRAQSVVSYTISNLEAQLEVTLFDRTASRQSQLTESGRAMLGEARRIVSDLHQMRALAVGLKQGLEGEVSAAISVMVPTEVLVTALSDFRKEFPLVALRLHVGALGEVTEMVATGKANFAIGNDLLKPDDSLSTVRIGQSHMLPTAAADHPLATLGRPISIADVREEVQLVVTDSSGHTNGKDFNVFSYRIWRVSDIATKRQLVLAGLGWGGLPAAMVWDDLNTGKLVRLQFDAYGDSSYALYAITANARPPGPASKWLIDRFARGLSLCPVTI